MQAQPAQAQPMQNQAGQPQPMQPQAGQAQPGRAQAQPAQPLRPQVTHSSAPISPMPQLQPPAATQQLPAQSGVVVPAGVNRPAVPQAASANGHGPANEGATGYGPVERNGHAAANGSVQATGYPANTPNSHGQPEPARVGGSAYGSPVAAASGGLGAAGTSAAFPGSGTSAPGTALSPARRSSEGGYRPPQSGENGSAGRSAPSDFGPAAPNGFGATSPHGSSPANPSSFGATSNGFGATSGPAGPPSSNSTGPNALGSAGPNGLGPAGPNGLGSAGPNGFGSAGPNGTRSARSDGFGSADSGGFGPAGPTPSGTGPASNAGRPGAAPFGSPAAPSGRAATAPTSPGTYGSPAPANPSVPGLRPASSTVPGGGRPAAPEDVAATRQLPAPIISGAKTGGVWVRPETDFIEQPQSAQAQGPARTRQDPGETAVIRTTDAPTGLLPAVRKPTSKVGVPGAAAEAAKAAAEPDAVLGAVPVTEVRPGNPDETELAPADDGEPKRGEKVVKLRPEQTDEGYESVYSKMTRPTVGTRIRAGIRVSGELMITFGLIVLLFAGYEVFGNGAKVQSEQDSLNSKLDQDWADPTVGPTKQGPAAPGDSLVGRLYIPKFAKEWVVVNGVLPDNIKYAPGHYPDTAMPGQVGNFSVAGHRIPKIFWRINELKTGDVIGVETRDSWYIYKVYGQEIVKPDAVQVVEPVPDQPGVKATKALLTLTTCNPKGNNYQRLIVHAQLASQVKRDSSQPDAGMPAEMKAKY
jgi:sortase A